MSNLTGLINSIRNIFRQDKGVAGDLVRIEQLAWMLFLKLFDDKDLSKELTETDYISPIPEELQWRNWAGDDEGITGKNLLDFVNDKLFPGLKQLKQNNEISMMISSIFDGVNNYMKNGTTMRRVINKINEIDFNIKDDIHQFNDLYEGFLFDLTTKKDSGEFYTPRPVTDFMTEMTDPKLNETVLDPSCGTGGFLVSTISHIRENSNMGVEDLKKLRKNIQGQELKSLPYMLAVINLIINNIDVPNLTYQDTLSREYASYSEKDRVDVILTNPPFGASVADGGEMNFPTKFRTKETADLFFILIMHLLKSGGRASLVLPDGSITSTTNTSGELSIKGRILEKLLTECNLHTIVRLPDSVFKPYATVATNLLFFEKGEPTKYIWYYEITVPGGQKAFSKTKPIKNKDFELCREWWINRKENDYAWRVSIDDIKENNWDLDIKNPNVEVEEELKSSDEIITLLSKSFSKSNEIALSIKEVING